MRNRSFASKRAPRLGQHFLKRPGPARTLAHAAEISPGDTVLEIGPGEGVLTRELLAPGAKVIAIEKDASLVAKLRITFAPEIASGQLFLLESDIRDFDLASYHLSAGSWKLAANIPYYITGEIIRMFLSTEVQPRTMALLVQKEVAQRIVAKKESILSLSIEAYGTPKIAAKVPRGNFSPPPSVDSAILVVSNISKKFFDTVSEIEFFAVVRAGFSSKRKQLAGNLTKLSIPKTTIAYALAHCAIAEDARAEDVPLAKWKCLAHELSTNIK